MPYPPGTVKDARLHVSLSDGTTTDLHTGADGRTDRITRDAMHVAQVEVRRAPHAGGYPHTDVPLDTTCSVLLHGGGMDKIVHVPRENPCNVIVVHGVNDVGMAYGAVEEGVCRGLGQRLHRPFTPAAYTIPSEADRREIVDDPDLKFFRRKAGPDTCSPIIPFYWGFREAGRMIRTVNGQKTDRYGTRLDKDLSKGGGPFGNATSTLPDMWNRGVCVGHDIVGDPLRPLRTGPGRMYMVLAAQRLAALVAMIRQYEPADTVNIVAHSQGCLLSLLAQAFLMERGERTADTLILTHPPYSLDEEMGVTLTTLGLFKGGEDLPMHEHYSKLAGRQTLHARLQTLVNIVAGVERSRNTEPAFTKLSEYDCGGSVGWHWKPERDRDNRGKVYLYFCPEDMTVALDNMRGIGWQGVPDLANGTQCRRNPYASSRVRADQWTPTTVARTPLRELGQGFRQRVFTVKLRQATHLGQAAPVLVGQAPHDFVLRYQGEDDHAHVARSVRSFREALPETPWPSDPRATLFAQRQGIRTINGEQLAAPFKPDLRGAQIDADRIPAGSRLAQVALKDRGPAEAVDPVTACTAVTAVDLRSWREEIPDPTGHRRYPASPQELPLPERQKAEADYNLAKGSTPGDPDDAFTITSVVREPDGRVIAHISERPKTARLRWQQELGEKSFHSSIFESAENHCHVTAYDLSIGSGKATSDPKFHAYLCAVADWRLTRGEEKKRRRPGILRWSEFQATFGLYFSCEPVWRAQLIEGNVDYYSSGDLPACLPVLTGGLWSILVSETTAGEVVVPSGQLARGGNDGKI
jgi:hypothetical protein